MYKIFADGVCIFDDESLPPIGKSGQTITTNTNQALLDPVLVLEENRAGSLEFTMPLENDGYSLVKRTLSEIVVERDGSEIWAGRVLEDSLDFYGRRKIFCEGELAYLNDTIQTQREYHDITVRGFLDTLLGVHDGLSDVTSDTTYDKQFEVGIVTVTDSNDSLYRYTNYETTLECIQDKLIDRLGGHLRIRKQDGIRYLDYLKDYDDISSSVQFGVNLLDIKRSWDMSEFATVLLPLGASRNSDEFTALQSYVDVRSVNKGSPFVTSSTVSEFGWIVKKVQWSDIETPEELLKKAQKYLSETQFEEMEIEVKAVDLQYLDNTQVPILLGTNVHVTSIPHSLDTTFPVQRLEIPLDRPEEAVITLGKTEKRSLTSISRSSDADLLDKINSIEPPSAILKSAKDNATQMIQNATMGYVSILKDGSGTQEILITNNADYTRATKVWRWNINGLGYSSTGYNGSYDLAMTMDGSIVADRITTGSMYADRIMGGTLTLGGANNTNGRYVLKSGNGTPTILMSNEGMFMLSPDGYYLRVNTNGQITGGIYNGHIGNDFLTEMFDTSNYTQYGIFDAAAEVSDYRYDPPVIRRGLRIKTDMLHLVSDHLVVTDSMDDEAVGLYTYSGELRYMVSENSYRTLVVKNGLIVAG